VSGVGPIIPPSRQPIFRPTKTVDGDGSMHRASMHTCKMHVLGSDIFVDAYYYWSPAERATRDYPGCPVELDVVAVSYRDISKRHFVAFSALSDDEQEEIERQIEMHMRDLSDGYYQGE